jgi:hypothetical protein
VIDPQVLSGYAARMSTEQDRLVSETEAIDEIHRVIDRICEILSKVIVFGYHEPDDIYQEAYVQAVEVLSKPDKYDPARPLENFLYFHVLRRLRNKKRGEVFRSEAPCKCCDAFDPGPNPCDRWRRWDEANRRKMCLAGAAQQCPEHLSTVRIEPAAPHENLDEILIRDELDEYILSRLDPELLEDYELLKAEKPLTKHRRTRLRESLREIVRYSPWAPADEIPAPPPPPPVVASPPEHEPPPKPKPKRTRKPKPVAVVDPPHTPEPEPEPVNDTGPVIQSEPARSPEVDEPPAEAEAKPARSPRRRKVEVPRPWWVRLWAWLQTLWSSPDPVPPQKASKAPGVPPRLYEYGDEAHSLREWSQLTGIPVSRMRYRLKAGWEIGQVLGYESRPTMADTRHSHAKLYTARGETHSIRGWARKLGIDHCIVRDRLGRGWTMEEIIDNPVRPRSIR